mmetsp:Transcript_58928/g.167235  ORF Transcript_58928/g.167235 Transcript_58928/m.167235 type:complete len:341 (-) Transcript_58928:7-1029(-)
MSADEMERDGILQTVLPFILLEIQRELCHLLRPQRLSIHAVRFIIESHDPINLLLVLRVVHDNLPSVHERIVQCIFEGAIELVVVCAHPSQSAVEAGDSWHVRILEEKTGHKALHPEEVRRAVDVLVGGVDVLDSDEVLLFIRRHGGRDFHPARVTRPIESDHNSRDDEVVHSCVIVGPALTGNVLRPQREHLVEADPAAEPLHHTLEIIPESRAGERAHLVDIIGNPILGSVSLVNFVPNSLAHTGACAVCIAFCFAPILGSVSLVNFVPNRLAHTRACAVCLANFFVPILGHRLTGQRRQTDREQQRDEGRFARHRSTQPLPRARAKMSGEASAQCPS